MWTMWICCDIKEQFEATQGSLAWGDQIPVCDQCEYITAYAADLKKHKDAKHEGIRYTIHMWSVWNCYFINELFEETQGS